MKITKEEARSFLVRYHGLSSSDILSGEEGILQYIKRVGCIQYDPLNVVGRNADLVLQSRIENYNSSMLENLLYKERKLIDGWDKMMSIYSQEDWPCFRRLRKQREKEIKSTLRNRGSLEALKLTDEILSMLKQHGPLQASKISIGKGNTGRWGHRNLSSAALDFMFNSGELGIYSKKNTQKIYALIENLLPKELLNGDPFADDREFYKWYFKRRIGGLGLIWGRNGGGWLGQFLSDKKLRASIIDELLDEKSIVALNIEEIEDVFYMRSEDISLLKSSRENREAAMRFLAPLDNILWDRNMIKEIFDFQYSWEVYVPESKRKYGYYVLPVLYGSELVARFEPEMHRNKGPLIIKKWWWEDKVTITDDVKSAVKECLEQFCNYLQAEGIHTNSVEKIFNA